MVFVLGDFIVFTNDIILVYWWSSNKEYSVELEDFFLGFLKGSKILEESKY